MCVCINLLIKLHKIKKIRLQDDYTCITEIVLLRIANKSPILLVAYTTISIFLVILLLQHRYIANCE